ncbi:CDP-glycerol glycerophosphotransferase family protein, partial [Vibrio parahaemolyticus]
MDVSDAEIQDLLCSVDAVVTDYSSVTFDAFAGEIPVVLWAPDREEFEEFRGVYSDIWQSLEELVVDDLRGL